MNSITDRPSAARCISAKSAARAGTLTHVSLASFAIAVVLGASACAGTQAGRSAGAEKVSTSSSPMAPSPGALKPQAISASDWSSIQKEKIAPDCDARQTPAKADAAKLAQANKIIGAWTQHKARPKKGPETGKGVKLGVGEAEPTRVVTSLGLTCSLDKNAIEVNGTEYPFDVAWVVAGVATAGNIPNDNVGESVLIQALSFKDKRVVIGKVFAPTDASKDTDDTVVVAEVQTYMPADVEEPIVHAVGQKDRIQLETFIFGKGSTSGFYFLAPQQDDFGRERYLAVGKFDLR